MTRERLVPVGVALAFVCSFVGRSAADTFVAKKDKYLAAKLSASADAAAKKRWQASLKRRIGKRPARLINIYNGHTEEILVESDSVLRVPGIVNTQLAFCPRCRNRVRQAE